MTTNPASAPVVSVTPADGLIDEPRCIVVTGLAPDELVAISARTVRAGGVLWYSQATFMADADGVVDLTRDAPVGGDYAEISAMGRIWSQKPVDRNSQALVPDDVMQPLKTALTAETAAGVKAEGGLLQRLATEGVERQEIREDGLVGTLFAMTRLGADAPTPAIGARHTAAPTLNNGGYWEFNSYIGPYNIGIEIENSGNPGRGHCFDQAGADNSWGRAGVSQSCFLDTSPSAFYNGLIHVEYWLR